MIYDGTHRLSVNSKIKVRDQIPAAIAGEVRAVLSGMPGTFFGLTGDVKSAHRLVKISKQDWGQQACRTGLPSPDWVSLNCVGTFGISSAAYHWGRLMAAIGRAAFYMISRSELEQLIYVDDIL